MDGEGTATEAGSQRSMKLDVILFACVVVVLAAITAHADHISYESRVLTYFKDVVKEVEDHGLSGPIGSEAAKFALLRRIHEDGLDRPVDISMNGMVPGSPNKEVIQQLYMPGCKLGKVPSNDGQGCYVIKGPRANVMGAVAIALWYDAIINSDKFRICNDEERKIWNDSRHCSHRIAIGDDHPRYILRFKALKKQRIEILEKVNRAYGPQGQHINGLRKKLEPFFDIAVW